MQQLPIQGGYPAGDTVWTRTRSFARMAPRNCSWYRGRTRLTPARCRAFRPVSKYSAASSSGTDAANFGGFPVLDEVVEILRRVRIQRVRQGCCGYPARGARTPSAPASTPQCCCLSASRPRLRPSRGVVASTRNRSLQFSRTCFTSAASIRRPQIIAAAVDPRSSPSTRSTR